MTLSQILEGGGIGVVILMTLIQVMPIKINPWSWLAAKIGGALNKELTDKVDTLQKELKSYEAKQDERNAVDCRTRILRFGDEVLYEVKHTKEHFEQILCDIDEYDKYCAAHPDFKNNKTVFTSKRIKEVYEKLLEDNDFL